MTNWVSINELKAGQYIHFDGGSDCMKAGPKEVKRDEQKGFYVDCEDGRHYLDTDAKDSVDVVGFTVNPLITAVNRVTELRPWLNDPSIDYDVKESDKQQDEINALFNTAMLSADKRLALIAVRAASLRRMYCNSEEARYEHEVTYCAAQFTPDAFEATLVGLALYGCWNDTLEAACKTLGIDLNTDLDEQLAEKYPF